MRKIRFLDLKPQYKSIEDDVHRAIEGVLSSQQFILGARVMELEERLAEYCGTKHAVGVASGSDAILLALMAIGIGEGDEVITTPFTFFSSVSSITRLGAKPVFVDIDPLSFNIDAAKISAAMTDRTKAILVVHLYGQPVDMDPILEVASSMEIKVVEDACQSIGAKYKGKRVGSIGDVGCFSFFPTKNLGGYGDGGLVTTSDDEIAEKIRALRVHGSRRKYLHDEVGINSRLDEIQAAVLLVKLPYLDEWNEKRRRNAAFYGARLKDIDGVTPPNVYEYNESVFNQYVVRVSKRDELREYLSEKGVGSEIYYPLPLHMQKCFAYLGFREGDFPESERASKEVLALPIYPELSTEELEFVTDTINSFYA